MDLFYQWVWIYAAPVKFPFVLQTLPPFPTVFGIYTFFNLGNDWLQKFERLDMVKMYSQRKKWEWYCLNYLQYDKKGQT